ncbi:MAG: hypothetical protein AB8G05_26165 [Oligoflexales bacterium]
MFKIFTVVSILSISSVLYSCKQKERRSVNIPSENNHFEIENRKITSDERLSLTEGIASSDSSMLISDNLAHYNELLERKYPRLIAMPVEQQVANGQQLSESDFNNLKRNIADRIYLYYHPDAPISLKTQYPILSFQVNTSGIHWETVIVDLNDLTLSPPNLKFEQWNFLGGTASLAPKKINQVRAAVVDVMNELGSARHFEPRNITETFKQKPSFEDLHAYLIRYHAGNRNIAVVREVDSFFVDFSGQRFPVLLEEAQHDYFGKSWEVRHTAFQEFKRPKKLIELLEKFNKNQVNRPAINGPIDGSYLNIANLQQGHNNCGVASAWITEQRAKGLKDKDFRTVQPDGYHEYRRTMLRNLHNEFIGTKLPQSGALAYPRPSYKDELPKKIPTVMSRPTLNPEPSIKTPSFGKDPHFSEYDFDARSKPSSYKKWWIGHIAFAAITGGYVIYTNYEEQRAKKKKAPLFE